MELTDQQRERVLDLGHKARRLMDELICIVGADGEEFSTEELVVLEALELIRVKLFALTGPRRFRSAEDSILDEQLATILREMKDLGFARYRGRADFQRYIQGGR